MERKIKFLKLVEKVVDIIEDDVMDIDFVDIYGFELFF